MRVPSARSDSHRVAYHRVNLVSVYMTIRESLNASLGTQVTTFVALFLQIQALSSISIREFSTQLTSRHAVLRAQCPIKAPQYAMNAPTDSPCCDPVALTGRLHRQFRGRMWGCLFDRAGNKWLQVSAFKPTTAHTHKSLHEQFSLKCKFFFMNTKASLV